MNEGSLAGTLVRLVLSLGMVLALMILLARFLRHRQNGTGMSLGMGATQRRKATPPLQVLTRQGLSRGSSIAVVRVSGQLLLLGVTESTVCLLRELDDPDEELDPDTVNDSPRPEPVLSGSRELIGSAVELLRRKTVRRG
jgi:flagellar protein FliO/FliZ